MILKPGSDALIVILAMCLKHFYSFSQALNANRLRHYLSQNNCFLHPKEPNKKVDCQNLRKLGEICWPSGYNFRANYCYFEKRNVIYCIFNGVTFDSHHVPNLSNIIILSQFSFQKFLAKLHYEFRNYKIARRKEAN